MHLMLCDFQQRGTETDNIHFLLPYRAANTIEHIESDTE